MTSSNSDSNSQSWYDESQSQTESQNSTGLNRQKLNQIKIYIDFVEQQYEDIIEANQIYPILSDNCVLPYQLAENIAEAKKRWQGQVRLQGELVSDIEQLDRQIITLTREIEGASRVTANLQQINNTELVNKKIKDTKQALKDHLMHNEQIVVRVDQQQLNKCLENKQNSQRKLIECLRYELGKQDQQIMQLERQINDEEEYARIDAQLEKSRSVLASERAKINKKLREDKIQTLEASILRLNKFIKTQQKYI